MNVRGSWIESFIYHWALNAIVKSDIIEQKHESRKKETNTLGKNGRSLVESGMDNAAKYGFIKRIRV